MSVWVILIGNIIHGLVLRPPFRKQIESLFVDFVFITLVQLSFAKKFKTAALPQFNEIFQDLLLHHFYSLNTMPNLISPFVVLSETSRESQSKFRLWVWVLQCLVINVKMKQWKWLLHNSKELVKVIFFIRTKYKTILHLSLQEKTLYKHDMLRWLLSAGKNAQSLLTMVAQKVISSSRSSERTSA